MLEFPMSALIVALNNLVQKRFVCRLDEFGAFIAKTESFTETVVFHTIEDSGLSSYSEYG